MKQNELEPMKLQRVRMGAAGNAAANSLVPLDHLLVGVVVAVVAVEGVRVDETTEGVTTLQRMSEEQMERARETHEVSTVGVELSSTVVGLNVDLRLVDVADDLEVAGSLHELDTSERALGDDAGTAALLGAPGDFLALGVTDGGVGLGGRPDTPVVGVVDEGGLAERVGALGGGVAKVVALLGPTDTVVRVGLIGLIGQGGVTARPEEGELGDLQCRRGKRSAWKQGG